MKFAAVLLLLLLLSSTTRAFCPPRHCVTTRLPQQQQQQLQASLLDRVPLPQFLPELPDHGVPNVLLLLESIRQGGGESLLWVTHVVEPLERVTSNVASSAESVRSMIVDGWGTVLLLLPTTDIINQAVVDLWTVFLAKANSGGGGVDEAAMLPFVMQPGDEPAVLAAVSVVMATSAVLLAGGGRGSISTTTATTSPYPTGQYDAETAAAFFDARPGRVVSRAVQIAVLSTGFGLTVLSDQLWKLRHHHHHQSDNNYNNNYNNDATNEREEQRGQELARLLTQLGPSFIKVGQSLSIRTDLLSPAYLKGLTTLQDNVPAFDHATAVRTVQEEWGGRTGSMILPDEPVAAASLGQVYKATLDEQQQVAIKVQRPHIMEQIALDMYLVRNFGALIKQLFRVNTDTVGTVDAWAAGFVDELDYLQEARNAEAFNRDIQGTPLKEVVFAPVVVQEYSTGKVLVTEWVDGERLDRSSSEDVSVLCSVAMNSYLTMLLDLGLLHCDPHPGNLLRTPEGRLCILDWGMVTRLDKQLQLTLVEHMAHLTSADYAEVPRDLLLLGFIPQDKAHLIEDSGVVELLAEIYGAWTSGGGAAAINVPQVVAQLQDLTAKKGNLFQIPPYFAYIAKSFSVLEGIGLSNDPKYSIINECLPYVSQRLLTDTDGMGPALSTFVFGPQKSDQDRIIEYKRVKQLVEGFGDYSTSSAGALLGKESTSTMDMIQDSADQILDLVFSEKETPLQQIMLEQLAKILASSSRSVFTQIREQSGTLPSGRTLLGTIVDPLGVWRTSPLVRMNDLDDHTLETTRKIVELVAKQVEENDIPIFDARSLSRQELTTLVSVLTRKVWERRIGVLQTGNRFARQLLEQTARTLENGERDSRRLSNNNNHHQDVKSLSSSYRQTGRRMHESQRLRGARALLDELQETKNSDRPEEKTQIRALPVLPSKK